MDAPTLPNPDPRPPATALLHRGSALSSKGDVGRGTWRVAGMLTVCSGCCGDLGEASVPCGDEDMASPVVPTVAATDVVVGEAGTSEDRCRSKIMSTALMADLSMAPSLAREVRLARRQRKKVPKEVESYV